jgi:prepilin-type N-terminal cleavage/methylation domain-containing protein
MYERSAISRRLRKQAGFNLLEVLIAATILAIGMVGMLPMFIKALSFNNLSRGDTQGVLISQLFLEQLSTMPVPTTAPSQDTSAAIITMQDCANPPNTFTLATVGNTSGLGAPLNSSGNIDWTQPGTQVPAGYGTYPQAGVYYTSCGANQMQYEVRWNIQDMPFTANSAKSQAAKLIKVSSRPVATLAGGNAYFQVPITLHAVGGEN